MARKKWATSFPSLGLSRQQHSSEAAMQPTVHGRAERAAQLLFGLTKVTDGRLSSELICVRGTQTKGGNNMLDHQTDDVKEDDDADYKRIDAAKK